MLPARVLASRSPTPWDDTRKPSDSSLGNGAEKTPSPRGDDITESGFSPVVFSALTEDSWGADSLLSLSLSFLAGLTRPKICFFEFLRNLAPPLPLCLITNQCVLRPIAFQFFRVFIAYEAGGFVSPLATRPARGVIRSLTTFSET